MHRDDPSYATVGPERQRDLPKIAQQTGGRVNQGFHSQASVLLAPSKKQSPGRWFWREVDVPLSLPRAQVMLLYRVLRTLASNGFSPGSGELGGFWPPRGGEGGMEVQGLQGSSS